MEDPVVKVGQGQDEENYLIEIPPSNNQVEEEFFKIIRSCLETNLTNRPQPRDCLDSLKEFVAKNQESLYDTPYSNYNNCDKCNNAE